MNKRVFNALRKQSSAAGDFWRSIPQGALTVVPVIGGPVGIANALGSGASVLPEERGKAAAIQKLIDYENKKRLSYAPGVGLHRVGRRARLLNQILTRDDSEQDTLSRTISDGASVLNPLNWIAAPFAALAAGITKKRSLAEAAEAANDEYYGLKSALLPGWNVYNRLKAIGASDRISELHQLTERDFKELDPEVVAELQRQIKDRDKRDRKDS